VFSSRDRACRKPEIDSRLLDDEEERRFSLVAEIHRSAFPFSLFVGFFFLFLSSILLSSFSLFSSSSFSVTFLSLSLSLSFSFSFFFFSFSTYTHVHVAYSAMFTALVARRERDSLRHERHNYGDAGLFHDGTR